MESSHRKMRSRNCGFSETRLKLGNLKTLAFRFHVENILKTELFENHGVAIIMPGAFTMTNPRKMKRHFPIKSGQLRGMAPFISEFPTPRKPVDCPNIPVGRNRNGPFHLNSDRNFRSLRHNAKHATIRICVFKVLRRTTV